MFYLPSGERGTVHSWANPNAHSDAKDDTQTASHYASPSNASVQSHAYSYSHCDTNPNSDSYPYAYTDCHSAESRCLGEVF